jgi:membrane protease YdiL (CAAX protease family)
VSSPDHDTSKVAPMTLLGACGWTISATLAFFFAWSTAIGIREGAKDDLVTGALSQIVGYGITLFLALRVYAPDTSLRRVLGVRATSPAITALAPLVGVALYLPIDALYELISSRFPTGPDSLPGLWEQASLARRAVMAVALVALGPLVEEAFFRGMLLRPLVREAERRTLTDVVGASKALLDRAVGGTDPSTTPAARPLATYEAVLASAGFFAMVHVEWQKFVPLLVMGALLGALRVRSGSLAPSLLAHAAFNAVAVAQLAHGDTIHPPAGLVMGSTLLAFAVLALTFRLAATSPAAALARQDEP